MNDMMHWSSDARAIAADRRAARPSRALPGSELLAIVSAAVTGLVMIVGFAIALIFAATVAVVMVLAAGLFMLATLAWRVRPRPATISQPRAGHAWVTYRWDDTRR